jgi:hypothetical protein
MERLCDMLQLFATCCIFVAGRDLWRLACRIAPENAETQQRPPLRGLCLQREMDVQEMKTHFG